VTVLMLSSGRVCVRMCSKQHHSTQVEALLWILLTLLASLTRCSAGLQPLPTTCILLTLMTWASAPVACRYPLSHRAYVACACYACVYVSALYALVPGASAAWLILCACTAALRVLPQSRQLHQARHKLMQLWHRFPCFPVSILWNWPLGTVLRLYRPLSSRFPRCQQAACLC
jgi:hypothetical protein